MRTFKEIYSSIKNSFNRHTSIEVTDGTAIDAYLLASSEGIAEAHVEIENSKNPHIYTNLKGKDIDKMALLLNCPRLPNETDNSYLYRCLKWTLVNESGNSTSIESALSNLEYSSNATYVPYTEGTGTATIFIIPKTYGDSSTVDEEKSISEIKSRLDKVISPDSYIKYQLCKPLGIEVVVYSSFKTGFDVDAIKNNINLKVKEYVNSIAIGDTLSYGEINKIGLGEAGTEFFNATHIYIGENVNGLYKRELLSTLNTIQTIETKFLFKNIEWRTVVD